MSLDLSSQQLFWMHLLNPAESSVHRIKENLSQGADPWEPIGLMKNQHTNRVNAPELLLLSSESLNHSVVLEKLNVLPEFMREANNRKEAQTVSDVIFYLFKNKGSIASINSWWSKRGPLNSYIFSHKLLRDLISNEHPALSLAVPWAHKKAVPSSVWADDLHHDLGQFDNPQVQSAYLSTFRDEPEHKPRKTFK